MGLPRLPRSPSCPTSSTSLTLRRSTRSRARKAMWLLCASLRRTRRTAGSQPLARSRRQTSNRCQACGATFPFAAQTRRSTPSPTPSSVTSSPTHPRASRRLCCSLSRSSACVSSARSIPTSRTFRSSSSLMTSSGTISTPRGSIRSSLPLSRWRHLRRVTSPSAAPSSRFTWRSRRRRARSSRITSLATRRHQLRSSRRSSRLRWTSSGTMSSSSSRSSATRPTSTRSRPTAPSCRRSSR
mmetsp:Transcript_2127/g.4321  ORF Transcript_2127/g.4321 Transcript_2127/m.4321 type:complete len:241 (+) Transcript_2127:404-1126(+)